MMLSVALIVGVCNNAMPWGHYTHFAEEETEALKAEANCPKAMSKWRQWTFVVSVGLASIHFLLVTWSWFSFGKPFPPLF